MWDLRESRSDHPNSRTIMDRYIGLDVHTSRFPLGIVTRSSSGWVRTQTGEWVKAGVKRTLGPEPQLQPHAEGDLRGSGTMVIGRRKDEPIHGRPARLPEPREGPLPHRLVCDEM